VPSPGAGAAQAAQGDFAFAFAAAAAAAAVVALAACAAAFPAAVSAGARRAGAPSHEARAHCCFLHRSQAAGAKSRRPRGAAPWRAAAPIWRPPRLAAPRQPRAPRAYAPPCREKRCLFGGRPRKRGQFSHPYAGDNQNRICVPECPRLGRPSSFIKSVLVNQNPQTRRSHPKPFYE